MTILNETYTLASVEIPKLGLGTWFIDGDRAADAIREAVEIGYRNIDTAQAYGNERGVGVRTSGVPRDDLFVSTKLAAEIKDYEGAATAIDGSADPGPGVHRPDAHPLPAAVGRLPRRRLRRRQSSGVAGAGEAHKGNTPAELLAYCAEKQILVEAYSPIAHGAILARTPTDRPWRRR